MAENPLKVGPTSNPPLRDQAFSTLRDAIPAGKFAPGARLVELELANSLGLSRSPVREAFRRLEQEGFLRVHRTGVTVQQIPSQDIQGIVHQRGRAALEEHRVMVESIARHDAVKANRLAQAHPEKSWEHTRRAFEKITQ